MTLMIHRAAICVECDQDLEHCHGTALIRANGSHVCSDDPDCVLEIESHVFVALDE